jgi:hypothetical protein
LNYVFYYIMSLEVSMKTLILILMIPVLSFSQYALNVPEGYEIVSQTENRIEVKDLATGFVTPYYIGDWKDSSNIQLDAKDNGIHEWFYFERVAELPWYYDIHSGDADHNDLGEVYGSVIPTMHRNAFLYPWVFENFDYNSNFSIKDIGDVDGDSLVELLILEAYEGVKLMESRMYNGYPDTVVWFYPWYIYFSIDAKLGDLDGDGLGEVLFYDGTRSGYQIFENIGDNQYEYKTKIRFSEYVGDYTGEPSSGDVDGDGWNEVFAGGIHGEIIMFECVADDSFEFVWQGYAQAPNAYSTEFLGDTDGDGFNEFMVGAKGGGFRNTIWEADGDNSYELKFTNIQYGDSWGDSYIEPADYDGDGSTEIAICTNDNLSIIKNFGNDDWRRSLHFYTGSSASYVRTFYPDTALNPALINNIRSPEWTTWVYNVKGTFIPADVNANGRLTGSDVLYLVNVLRHGNLEISEPYWRADANGDCEISWSDVTYLVNYFKGSGEIPEPGWCYFYVE